MDPILYLIVSKNLSILSLRGSFYRRERKERGRGKGKKGGREKIDLDRSVAAGVLRSRF